MIQVYSCIEISGVDLDPDAVTVALGGLAPHTAYRRDSPMPTGRPHTKGVWTFATDDSVRKTIEASLDDLFARLAQAWPGLVDLSSVFQIDVECFVKVYDDPPELAPTFAFEARHVLRAAELGASLGIDFYDFRGTGVDRD